MTAAIDLAASKTEDRGDEPRLGASTEECQHCFGTGMVHDHVSGHWRECDRCSGRGEVAGDDSVGPVPDVMVGQVDYDVFQRELERLRKQATSRCVGFSENVALCCVCEHACAIEADDVRRCECGEQVCGYCRPDHMTGHREDVLGIREGD